MNTLLAVALVCSAATLAPDCSRDTALDVAVQPAKSPLDCLMSGQVGMARAGVPEGTYVKVLCERRRTAGLR